MSDISVVVRSIRDIMRKDSGVDGDAQRISQLVWMLFLKIFSDQEEAWKKTSKKYVNPIPSHLRWKNWTSTKNTISDNDLINFINTQVFPTLKGLSAATDQAKIIASVFEDTHNYMRNGQLFRQVVNEINKIDFSNHSSNHIFNEIYESILKELQSAGSSGEYYTPRAITQFMVEMVQPKLNESILDPACGTGGFLTSSLDNILARNKKVNIEELQGKIIGVEKKPLPHLLCITNLMLHGLSVPLISRDNLLRKPLSAWKAADKFDVVFSNPPFGGNEEDNTETNFPVEFRTRETADLFVVLIMRVLKASGRAAVVLPDGFLFGEGVRTRIKEELLNQCNLHTIVRLPNGVFNPYTNIKTNLLFFDKGTPTQEVWYFEHQYPVGYKNYSKSKPISTSEFDLEKAWWSNRVENDYAWKVPISDIKKRNYNLDISSPYFGEDNDNVSSAEIIEKLTKSFTASQQILASLRLEY